MRMVTALPSKHHNGRCKAAEEKRDLEICEKEIWKRNVDGGRFNTAGGRLLGCFPGTSVPSALETFATIALYKSTYTIPYHTIQDRT